MIKNHLGIDLMSITLHNAQWPLDGELPDLVISKLSHLGLIQLTGEQAESFLHGQVTADVAGLDEQDWCWGAHCDPKGKMLASFRLFKAQAYLWMLMPKTAVTADLPQLQKYAVFSKVTLTDATQSKHVYGIAGKSAAAYVQQHFGEITQNITQTQDAIVIKDGERFMLVVDSDSAPQFLQQQSIFDSSSWQALEIESGYPNISENHSGEYIPQMCNLDAIGGINFNKGCYMGQETVARMKYRGGNKRALYILAGTVANQLTKDGFVEVELGSGYRKAGNIIEYVQRENQVLMTVVLANNTELTAKFRVAGDTQSALSIKPLPYKLEVTE